MRVSQRRDDGQSLPELLVSMMILGMIIAAVATLAIGFQRTAVQNITRQDQVDVARASVDRLSKTLRTAVKPNKLSSCTTTACDIDAFVIANTYSMQFYANLDNSSGAVRGPSRISYSVATSGPDAGVLVEKVQRPDTATPAAGAGFTYCNAEASGATAACRSRLQVRRLATDVRTSGGTPLFQYYRDDGSAMTVPSSGLTAADMGEVLSVEVTLRVRDNAQTSTGTTTYIQRILLPNSLAVLRPESDTP
ncbi:hypothetical protein GXP71_06930 [Cellulomonas sp. H30R-01]|jgi:type II secretory pathway pseudopilin PulG|uniref:prepilin-type N-terminal cleavage/methylation domain-containing protein n=1 Tax=Cellulomonas sp. H30R-01 TaxID=2704467 RepID=UPI00138B1DC8|nr:prepilin-type N-terminal cleavage/methylation domain-containing protein [Cellulomonas sp. H30R-01]QHT58273.1 hypothetical protein GXP71_06930 [Cellulomonas sp. H30R-01]